MRFIPEVKFCNEERLHIYQPLRDPDVQQQQHTQVMLYWGVISHMNYEVQQQLNGSNGAHYTPRPPDPPTPTIWNHTEAQQMSTIRTPAWLGLPGVWWRSGAALEDARSSPWKQSQSQRQRGGRRVHRVGSH